MIYFIVWGLFVYWYFCVVLFPNCFHNITDVVLEKEKMIDESKLMFIYLNKKTFPKLKKIAVYTIILFFMN